MNSSCHSIRLCIKFYWNYYEQISMPPWLDTSILMNFNKSYFTTYFTIMGSLVLKLFFHGIFKLFSCTTHAAAGITSFIMINISCLILLSIAHLFICIFFTWSTVCCIIQPYKCLLKWIFNAFNYLHRNDLCF